MSDERTERGDEDRGADDAPEQLSPELAAELRAAYNDPPPTPREVMWAEVERELEGAGSAAGEDGGAAGIPGSRGWGRPRPFRRRSVAVLGAAAVFLVGIGLGRVSVGDPAGLPGGGDEAAGGPEAGQSGVGSAEVAPPPPEGGAGSPEEWKPWARALARPSLDEAEFLLSFVDTGLEGADPGGAPLSGEVARWAESLLGQTRDLMEMDEVREDQELLVLLEDLELILVQVAHAPGREAEVDERRVEMELIAQGLEEKDLLARLQVAAANVGETFPEEGP